MKIITVGRSPENNIVIEDKRVSAKHLIFRQNEQGEIAVQDLQSTNGTFVNDQRIQQDFYDLMPTDTVKIGETILDWQNYFKENSTTPFANLADNNSTEFPVQEENKTFQEPSFSPKKDTNLRILWIGVISIGIIFLGSILLWYFTQVVKP